MLNIRQSYLAMFNLLDQFYNETKDDILGSLHGGFNLFLFSDGGSADPAAYEDWDNVVNKLRTRIH